jgi:chromosome segregation ATPase
LEAYGNQCQQFGPKIEKVVEQKKKLDECKARLDELDKIIENLNLKQQSIEDEINNLSNDTSEFEQQLHEMETDAHSAQEMLGQLDSEHLAYKTKKEEYEKQKQFIDADSILGAAMMVYGGICFEKDRPNLMKKFYEKLQIYSIKINNE